MKTEERKVDFVGLTGDRWETIELPVIGSKMLAVTNLGGLGTCARGPTKVRLSARGNHYVEPCPVKLVGRMEIHGKPGISWTRLSSTASAGSRFLHLEEAVDWEIDTDIVITPSDRHQDEVRKVAEILDGGFTVELDRPLTFEHLGIWYHHEEIGFSGRDIEEESYREIPTPTDLRAAVGRLTRNVKVQGDDASVELGNAYQFGVHVGAFVGGVMRIENTETGHHNLAVRPLQHPLLLDDDMDPAGFWLPGFTGWHRNNLAAGCHRGWRVLGTEEDLTFFNNSAHASGFGWHLKPPHAPPTLNVFQNFTAFRCDTGMFYYGTGNILHDDHRFIECGTGHFMNHLSNGLHTPPFYHNLVLVGNIAPDATTARSNPGSGLGIRGPKDNEYFFVSGLTVINYFESPVLRGCFETTCTMRFERATWWNSTQRTWSTPRQIFWDLDGSLTGYPNGFVSLDYEYNHFPGLCHHSDEHGNGLVCGAEDGSVRVRRLLVDRQEPWQLDGKDMLVQTSAGSDLVAYDNLKLRGWPVVVVEGEEHGYLYTRALPRSEAIMVHVNFTDWRNHFDATEGLRYVNETGEGLKEEIDEQPEIDMVHGRLTASFSVQVIDTNGSYEAGPDTPTGQLRQEFIPRECPVLGCKRPDSADGDLNKIRRWSDPSGWPDGRLPAEMDNVVLPPEDCRDNVLLDIETPVLHWLEIQGRLEFDREVNATLHAHSVKVWGVLEMGTVERPMPPNVKAEIVLWGDEQSITVIMVEGLFLVNKVVAVLGNVSAVGSPSTDFCLQIREDSRSWSRLVDTAEPETSLLLVQGNQSSWPIGAALAISATEFPQPPATTETEVRRLAERPTTLLSLDEPLTHRHFAGVVDDSAENANWPRPRLAAAVSLLEILLHIRWENTDHGGEVVVASSADGFWDGQALFRDVDFLGLGKHLYQAPALKFNFLGGHSNISRVENCVFSRSKSGAIEANYASVLELEGNVFHRTYRSAVWLRDTCKHDSIVLRRNIGIETLRHPEESTAWVRQFGAFFLEVRPKELVGNDTGFILRPQLRKCQQGSSTMQRLAPEDLNEAVATVTGVFILGGCEQDR
eukprot:s3580_g1.t1